MGSIMKTWEEVYNHPKYQAMTPEERAGVQNDYFNAGAKEQGIAAEDMDTRKASFLQPAGCHHKRQCSERTGYPTHGCNWVVAIGWGRLPGRYH